MPRSSFTRQGVECTRLLMAGRYEFYGDKGTESTDSDFSDISLGDLSVGSSSALDGPPINLCTTASKGSVRHADGCCVPCIFFSRSKCIAGQDCEYCHAYHQTVRVKSGKNSRKSSKDGTATETEAYTLQAHMNVTRMFESLQKQHITQEDEPAEETELNTSEAGESNVANS